ncbi:MAG: helicase C-terminal domain-containing protein [Candidatus Asgardarchaeia archaeon]
MRNLEESLKYFPYESFRKGQKEMIESIVDALLDMKNVVIEAPNGIGKTVSVLLSTIPFIIENDMRLIYLSRTHSQITRVIDEMMKIRRKGANFSAVEFRAKREVCLNPLIRRRKVSARDAVEICSLLKKEGKCEFFNKFKYLHSRNLLKDKIDELMERPLKTKDVISFCKKTGICPYELNRLMGKRAKVVSAPYAYLVDPKIRETFLKSLEVELKDVILVFDEAHNLPDIARDAISSTLSTLTIERGIKEAEKYEFSDTASFLEDLIQFVSDNCPEEEGEVRLKKEDLTLAFSRLSRTVEVLSLEGQIVREDKMREGVTPTSYLSGISRFIESWLDSDEEENVFVASTSKGKRGLRKKLEIFALNPQVVLTSLLEAYSTISLSGTIHESYVEITGIGSKEYIYSSFPSIFDRGQYLILCVKDVTSKLTERDKENYERILEYVRVVVKETPHNVGIFCPSYEFLDELLEFGLKDIVSKYGKSLFVESAYASSMENDEMIKRFKKASKRSGGVLLGVMGGRNSEGCDFPGSEMESVCIIGIPLAKPTVRVESLIDYYKNLFGKKAKLYGYVIPAIYKAAQTAGRVVRSPEDRGVILLMDKRYLWPYYRNLLPRWLREEMRVVKHSDELGICMREFFR